MDLDEEFTAALRRQYSNGKLAETGPQKELELSPQDRVMLDFAVRLTAEPASMAEQDLDALRAVGFDDRAILQITMIAGWFNYINRIADALGVGRSR